MSRLKAILMGLTFLVVGAFRALGQEAVGLRAADMAFVIVITVIVVGGLGLIAWLRVRPKAQ